MNSRQRPPRAKSSEAALACSKSKRSVWQEYRRRVPRGAGAAGLSLCWPLRIPGRVAWQGLMASHLLP